MPGRPFIKTLGLHLPCGQGGKVDGILAFRLAATGATLIDP